MPLRLVVWNCAMALDRKFERLLALRPDIAVIPECAEPDVLRRKALGFAFADCQWAGTDRSKGLGVFAFGDLTLRRHDAYDPRFHIFLPVEVRGAHAVNLLAVCAYNHRIPPAAVPNPRTTGEAVAHYAPFLRGTPGIVAGDFNASVIWDRPGRPGNFAALDASLGGLGLASAYHATTGDSLGAESRATLFWKKKTQLAFHIDYAYVPREWAARGCAVDVGAPEDWLRHSDHAPVTIDLS